MFRFVFVFRCNTHFWFGRRKHHCRSCGGIFCSSCSNQFKPVPSEQLYDPVRVCDNCNADVLGQRNNGKAASEGPVEVAEEAVAGGGVGR